MLMPSAFCACQRVVLGLNWKLGIRISLLSHGMSVVTIAFRQSTSNGSAFVGMGGLRPTASHEDEVAHLVELRWEGHVWRGTFDGMHAQIAAQLLRDGGTGGLEETLRGVGFGLVVAQYKPDIHYDSPL